MDRRTELLREFALFLDRFGLLQARAADHAEVGEDGAEAGDLLRGLVEAGELLGPDFARPAGDDDRLSQAVGRRLGS